MPMGSERSRLPRVEIWTDGGCRPNPGPGGWAAILRSGDRERELSGFAAATTNNRMELTAATEALEALTAPSHVVLSTDSQYLMLGITTWQKSWIRRGWRTADGKAVLNRELWQRLLAAAAPHEIEWRWVRGHAADAMNERADALASAAREAGGAAAHEA